MHYVVCVFRVNVADVKENMKYQIAFLFSHIVVGTKLYLQRWLDFDTTPILL